MTSDDQRLISRKETTSPHSPFLTWLWGSGGWLKFFRFPFTALSWIYGFISALRVMLYKKGILPQKKAKCPVVSIGNLTTGGTGKTPMTIFFAEQWQQKGKKVGIVSRGYQRKNKASVVLVSDGEKRLASASAVGDEPTLMADRLKGIPIVVASDRYQGCKLLCAEFKVDLILLDDAFQHLKLDRDLNILLIDATSPFGNGHLLPRGSLREPRSAIKRADYVIFTREDEQLPMENLNQAVEPFQDLILHSRFEATALIDIENGTALSIESLAGATVLPFCGIGNPEAFLKQLSDLGAKFVSPVIFEDHHDYEASDLSTIAASAKDTGANVRIVTTEKDAVKIKDFIPLEVKVFALRIGPVFHQDSEKTLSDLLASSLSSS